MNEGGFETDGSQEFSKSGNSNPFEDQNIRNFSRPREVNHIYRIEVIDDNSEKHNLEVEGIPLNNDKEPDSFAWFDKYLAELDKVRQEHIDDERYIESVEKLIGIEDPLGRDIETSLFIDWPILSTAVVDSYKNPERLFGNLAWVDWLNARMGASMYGRRPLTPDFITFIQTCLTKHSNPEVSGKLREGKASGTLYDDPTSPASFTTEQIETINQSSYLNFKIAVGGLEKGFIEYPNVMIVKSIDSLSPKSRSQFYKDGGNNQALINAHLVDLCEWYNNERSQQHDPYLLASKLQQRLISIHPFMDANGRTSRLIMQWSLENDSKPPAILFNPNDDVSSTEEMWREEVKYGSDLYNIIDRRKEQLEEIGYENTAELLGLSEAKTFYEYIFRNIQKAPKEPQNGELLNQRECELFVQMIDEEFKQFLQDFSSTSQKDGKYTTQGQLLPESYIDLMGLVPRDAVVYRNYLTDNYYSDYEIYRGAISQVAIRSEADVLRIFEEFTGVGSSYLALQKSHIPAMSTYTVPAQNVVESMKCYNRLISQEYFRVRHPQKPQFGNTDLKSIVTSHEYGHPWDENVYRSPFVSTTIDIEQTSGYANSRDEGKNGLVFSLNAPLFGTLHTFGSEFDKEFASDIVGLNDLEFVHTHEQEDLVAGAIHPGDIKHLDIKGNDNKLKYTAKRIVRKDGIYIDLESYDEEGLNRPTKRYKLNPATNQFDPIDN